MPDDSVARGHTSTGIQRKHSALTLGRVGDLAEGWPHSQLILAGSKLRHIGFGCGSTARMHNEERVVEQKVLEGVLPPLRLARRSHAHVLAWQVR